MQAMRAPQPVVYSIFSEVNEETHVLIGGATRSGKSVFEDGMIYNLAAQFTPQDVEIILIDPKMVQLRKWTVLPHVRYYADNMQRTLRVLDHLINVMMDRYEEMAECGLEKYEGKAIYCFIDEMADLTLGDKSFIPKVQKLLQLCGAANIHMVCCSQTVSRITIPAALQVNFTCRVGLRTDSAIDSRQIVKVAGCEKLPRYGKCILKTPDGIRERPFPMYPAENIKAMREFWWRQK